jgi:hypothetical protein
MRTEGMYPENRERPLENSAIGGAAIYATGEQSSPAGAPALARIEMRKSRSLSLAFRWRRAQARLSSGESLPYRHGAAAPRAKP